MGKSWWARRLATTGFGVTNTRRAINLGLAWINPLDIKGEVAIAASWAEPIAAGLRDQSGLEAYWKLLLLPNQWITAGFQYIRNPTFNSETDNILITQVKLSVFL